MPLLSTQKKRQNQFTFPSRMAWRVIYRIRMRMLQRKWTTVDTEGVPGHPAEGELQTSAFTGGTSLRFRVIGVFLGTLRVFAFPLGVVCVLRGPPGSEGSGDQTAGACAPG
jgi:hypothetical protein